MMYAIFLALTSRARISIAARRIAATCLLATGVPWLCAGAGIARSESPLPFAEALRIGEQRSAQLVASERSIDAARERAVAGAQLPDPVLRAGVDNLPINGADQFSLTRDFMTMRRIGVVQELTGSEKRKLRRLRGERAVEREQALKNAATARLRQELAAAWLERYFAMQTSQLQASLLGEVNLQIQTLESGIRSGRTSAAELRATQMVALQTEDQLASSRQQERAATQLLRRWLGDDAMRLPESPPDTEVLPAGTPEDLARLTHHAELAVAIKDEALAQSEVRLAQRSKTADWTFEVAYQQRGSAYSDMVSFGVSIPLPLFARDRQDRDILASQAGLAQAQATRQDIERLHRAELQSVLEDWQSLNRRIATLRTALLPLARDRIELTLASYRSGTATLAQVLEARRAEVDARQQVLSLRREGARRWAKLNFQIVDAPGSANHEGDGK